MSEKKTVAIIGNPYVGAKQVLKEVDSSFVIFDNEKITINGVAYIEREQKKKYPKSFAEIAIDNAVVDYMSSHYSRKLSKDIIIELEFALIQLKKSKLSKWERDEVVFQFNKKYKKIE